MKKINPLLLSVVFITGGLFHTAFAADATVITITANIVASPCTVNDSEVNINLGDIQASTLGVAGATSPWSDVKTISLTNCPVSTTMVQPYFSGTSATNGDINGYKNDGADQSISIQLADDSGAYLPNGGATAGVAVVNNSVDFKVKARLYTNGAAKPGAVSGTVNVSFDYK